MSTNDVPGYNPQNQDRLAAGAWAEHEDGSLILVEDVEANRVIYSMFDCAFDPVVEYREARHEDDFKRDFSWPNSADKWTWHDKTPFPWDRVIRIGARDGVRYADVWGQLNAATRVAQSLNLRGRNVTREDLQNRAAAAGSSSAAGSSTDDPIVRVGDLLNELQEAIKRLPAGS